MEKKNGFLEKIFHFFTIIMKNVTFTRQPSDRKALATFLRLSLKKKAIEEQKIKKPLRRGVF